MGNFYSRLSYSFGNEDWRTEKQALNTKKTSRVLCVTASGDRPLNILANPCKEVVSIDANPLQNALFDLKKTAMQHFEYADYLAFLGLDPMENRLDRYKEIAPKLSAQSRHLWDRHKSKIKKGVLFQGTIEKLARCSSSLIRLCRGKKVKKLFSFDCIDDQTQFVEDHFESPIWKKSVHVALHPQVTRRFLQDPGLYEYVDSKIHVGNHLYSRLTSSLKNFLARESTLLSLILKGDVDRNHLPPYLSEEHIETIQSGLDRVSYETTDLLTYLKNAPDNSFDRFSFSDVASYLPYKDFEVMLTELLRVAKPRARFCIRQFLTNYQVPEHLAPFFKRDSELEKKLEAEDRCFVYRFMVGVVVKKSANAQKERLTADK